MPARLRKHAIAAAMLATAAAAALFATASPASGDRVTVKGATIATYHYAPRTLQVEKGDTVHWHWSSNAPHNVTFKKISAHSPTGAAETFSHKFKKLDTYKYFCSVHGFTGFSFRDPEGNIWDVAWKIGSIVEPDGSLTWN